MPGMPDMPGMDPPEVEDAAVAADEAGAAPVAPDVPATGAWAGAGAYLQAGVPPAVQAAMRLPMLRTTIPRARRDRLPAIPVLRFLPG